MRVEHDESACWFTFSDWESSCTVTQCFHVLLKYYYTWLVIALLGSGRSPCLHVLLAGAGIWALWTWAVSVQVQQIAALKKFEPVAHDMCMDSPSSVWALFNAGGMAFSTRNSQCLYGHLVDEHEPRRWRSMFAAPHFMNDITQDRLALFWKVRIGISCAVTCMLWKAWPVISFIGNKLASDNTKMRHRHEFCTKSGREQGCMGLHAIIPREHGHMEGCLALSLLDPSQIKKSWCGPWWAGRGDTGLEVVDEFQTAHMLKPFASCFSYCKSLRLCYGMQGS